MKERLSRAELVEVAYNEELTQRIDEISNLSAEIDVLKTTIEELLVTGSKNKLKRTDSSLEFQILTDISIPRTGLEHHEEKCETVQHDLMSELHNYDQKLKEKDLEITSFDSKLKEKEETIEKQRQIIDFSSQFFEEIEAMNRIIENKTKREKSRSQDDGSLKQDSPELETKQEFVQVGQIHSFDIWQL